MVLIENLAHVLVFKTNIKTKEDKMRLLPLLNQQVAIEEWSVDCEDVDCVLRIVSQQLSGAQIITLVNTAGFYCEEME
jgi:hypothetical protein